VIQGGPPGVFCTYFYNHARRLRLEKLLYTELSMIKVPADILNYFWIQVAVSEVKRPLRNRFKSKTVTNLKRLYITAIPQRKQVSVRVWRLCN
jgi:hypothetical protein